VDGKVNYLFVGTEGQQYAYTISENGGLVAYIRQGDDPLKLTIKDIFSGKEKTVTLLPPKNGAGSYVEAGTLTWSVDESTLYLSATYRENGVDSGRLLAVDVANPANQKIVYERSAPFRLNQSSYHDWYASICPLKYDLESYCPTQLNLADGTIQGN
jgi:hypothetical protein